MSDVTTMFEAWVKDGASAVALTMRQTLLPVEGERGVVFPPTYVDIGYNTDTLSDGTVVATLDSVPSQANRLEPLFKQGPFAKLVPQVNIALPKEGTAVSLLDLSHRIADAAVRSTPGLSKLADEAFAALKKGNAGPLCALAPTSLLFGVWDSRGESGEKRPRILRSMVRAWDVEVLHGAAQFNSVRHQLDDETFEAIKASAGSKLSESGFDHAPAVFRKLSQAGERGVPEYKDGAPNPARRVLGGVLVRGRIERTVTINLVALRMLRGADDAATQQLREYLLGLALVAATHDAELFFREGCLLRVEGEDAWSVVPRRGAPTPVTLEAAQVQAFAEARAQALSAQWPAETNYRFDVSEAKRVAAKSDKKDAESKGTKAKGK